MPYYAVNQTLVPAEDATLHVHDLTILRGYGVFDYFQVQEGEPMFVQDYLARFERSAGLLELPLPISLEELKQLLYTLIAKNNMQHGAIKLLLTGGYSADGFTPAEPNLLALVSPPPSYPKQDYQQGVALLTYKHVREIPEAKSINYVTGIKLVSQLRSRGAVAPLYHDGRVISETDRANVLIVTRSGALATPSRNILAGVTRKHLLRLAREHYPVEERDITTSEVYSAQEVMITSSTRGVMPVTKVDDTPIGGGSVGEVSQHLHQLFTEHSQAYVRMVKAQTEQLTS